MIHMSDWTQTVRVTSPRGNGGALSLAKLRGFLNEAEQAGLSDEATVEVRGSNDTEIILHALETRYAPPDQSPTK